MKPFFGFTIAGIMMLSVVLVTAFSVMGNLGVSPTSDNSAQKQVNSVANMDNPEICLQFDNPNEHISSFAVLKKNPQLCVNYIDDEKLEYDCLSNFFRPIQDRVCEYVSDSYYEQCLIDAKDYEGFL